MVGKLSATLPQCVRGCFKLEGNSDTQCLSDTQTKQKQRYGKWSEGAKDLLEKPEAIRTHSAVHGDISSGTWLRSKQVGYSGLKRYGPHIHVFECLVYREWHY